MTARAVPLSGLDGSPGKRVSVLPSLVCWRKAWKKHPPNKNFYLYRTPQNPWKRRENTQKIKETLRSEKARKCPKTGKSPKTRKGRTGVHLCSLQFSQRGTVPVPVSAPEKRFRRFRLLFWFLETRFRLFRLRLGSQNLKIPNQTIFFV